MQTIVDINVIKDNIKNNIKDNLFNWLDIRNDFYNIGINVLEELLKIDNIGLFTDSLSDAIKIREFNKSVPIIVNSINNVEQVYDIIMHNLILTINDYDFFEQVNNLSIKDDLSLAINIKNDPYGEGISFKKYQKIKEIKNPYLIINNIFYYNSDTSLDLDITSIEKISSFVIGSSDNKVSDGFIGDHILKGAISAYSNVLRTYKLEKHTIFKGKKIKKNCNGIVLEMPDLNSVEKTILIDNQKWIVATYFDNCIYLYGDNQLKAGKKIDVTNYYNENYLRCTKKTYNLNGKIISLDNISFPAS